jgi:hypothetical protein
MAHPDMRPISFTYAPVTSMWVVTLHSLFLYSDPPLPCHLPSYWLRLFSSQTFSCINTPTFSNLVILHTYPPMKMEQTECSEMLAYKIQTQGNYPEESIQHTQNPTCITPVGNSQYDACTLETSFWILCSATHYTARKALLCSLICKWFLYLANHNVSMF